MKQLPKAIVFPFDSYLVLVVDETKSGDLNEFFAWMEKYLSQMGLNAGLSDPFYDLMTLPYYFTEAKAAIHLREHTGESFSTFAKCRDTYILQNCCGQLPPELLYTDGFNRLLEYNKNSSVDYIQTLKIWLEEWGNEARAASKLCICRNTFLYRLKQIKALFGDEAETMDGRFHLMLCLRLYERSLGIS